MDSSTRIAFLGASLIAGSISAPLPQRVVARLGQSNIQVLNAGVNGDLVWNVGLRAAAVIAWKPDVVFILAGSNDVLASLSDNRMRLYRRWKNLPQSPDAKFTLDCLNTLFDSVRKVPQVVVGTLPPLGEDLLSAACTKVRCLNEVISAESNARGWQVADIYAAIAGSIKPGSRPLPNHDRLVLSAAFQHHILRRSYDLISHKHGFTALSDGIHLTERSADVAADVIAGTIRQTAG